MHSFDIFADSSANLTDEMVAETGIKIIPFHYIINGQEKPCYEEGVPFATIAKEFYTELAKGTDIKTSLVCEQQFIDAVTPSLEAGRDAIIVTITEGLSGTFVQAMKAAENLKEKFPERKIFVVDSVNASLGEGFLAYRAAKMRDDGADIDECAKWLEDNKYLLNSYVTVNDLKYLKKGGRVSTIAAVAGAILNIKPMLKADGGSPATLKVYSKERGRKKSIDALLKGFADNAAANFADTVCIAHGDCEEEALALAEEFKKRGATDIFIEYYDLCTGAHVGPGTLAVFFLGKDRRTPQEVAEHKKRLSFLRRKQPRVDGLS